MLNGWCDAFNVIESNGVTSLYLYAKNRFKRMTVVLASCANLLINCG